MTAKQFVLNSFPSASCHKYSDDTGRSVWTVITSTIWNPKRFPIGISFRSERSAWAAAKKDILLLFVEQLSK